MRTEVTISVNANSIIGPASAGFLPPEVLLKFAFRINRDYAKKVDLIYESPEARDRRRGANVRVRDVILRYRYFFEPRATRSDPPLPRSPPPPVFSRYPGEPS